VAHLSHPHLICYPQQAPRPTTLRHRRTGALAARPRHRHAVPTEPPSHRQRGCRAAIVLGSDTDTAPPRRHKMGVQEGRGARQVILRRGKRTGGAPTGSGRGLGAIEQSRSWRHLLQPCGEHGARPCSALSRICREAAAITGRSAFQHDRIDTEEPSCFRRVSSPLL
jgi:hypothetical protein